MHYAFNKRFFFIGDSILVIELFISPGHKPPTREMKSISSVVNKLKRGYNISEEIFLLKDCIHYYILLLEIGKYIIVRYGGCRYDCFR